MAIDKVKWLKEHGPLPQFGRGIKVKSDKRSGNMSIEIHEKMHMKGKGITKRDQTK